MINKIIYEYLENRLSLRKVGDIFSLTKYQVENILKNNNVKIRCKSEAQKGRVFTEEHKLKLSKSHTGKTLTEEHKKKLRGRIPHNKGIGSKEIRCLVCGKIFFDKPYRRKYTCSKKCKEKVQGENHWNYKGLEPRGIQTKRNWKKYKEFKKAVHSRDKECLKCGDKTKLVVHHIIPWSEGELERFNIENGITLCEKCHRYLHKYCGQKKVNNKKQKEWLLINKIQTRGNV